MGHSGYRDHAFKIKIKVPTSILTTELRFKSEIYEFWLNQTENNSCIAALPYTVIKNNKPGGGIIVGIGGAILWRGGGESSLIARGGGRIRLRNAGNNNIC